VEGGRHGGGRIRRRGFSEKAWEILVTDAKAALVDCRTLPEWMFVGVPDLASIGKKTIFAEWQHYPSMQVNPAFAEQVRAGGANPESTLLFICRSGNRSKAAAIAMTAQGFARCYNVAEGFEGGLDAQSQRGKAAGWRAAGLPWKQE
jgi:Rhodanese-related sulfurtransferase